MNLWVHGLGAAVAVVLGSLHHDVHVVVVVRLGDRLAAVPRDRAQKDDEPEDQQAELVGLGHVSTFPAREGPTVDGLVAVEFSCFAPRRCSGRNKPCARSAEGPDVFAAEISGSNIRIAPSPPLHWCIAYTTFLPFCQGQIADFWLIFAKQKSRRLCLLILLKPFDKLRE